jgi:hypothetical protein
MAQQAANPEPSLQVEAGGLAANYHDRGLVNDFLSES